MKIAAFSIRHAEPCPHCGATEQERIDIAGEYSETGLSDWHGWQCRGCGKETEDRERDND